MNNTKFVSVNDKEFLENPFIKTLANILNTTPEKLFVTDEISNKKKQECDIKENNSLYPLTKDEMILLVSKFQEILIEYDTLNNWGIDFENTKLGMLLNDLVSTLLEFLFSAEFVKLFGKQNFRKNSAETIVDNLIKKYE